MRTWLLVLAGVVPLDAQVAIGVSGGVPFSGFIREGGAGSRAGFSRVNSAPRRYTLGPFLDFAVRGPVSIETGFLYKRFGLDTAAGSGGFVGPFITINSSTAGNSWEFPILGKVRFRLGRGVNGYLSLGPSIRHLSGITERGERTVRTQFPPPVRVETAAFETNSPPGMDRRTSIGIAGGAGAEFRAGPLRIAPGIRFTRWDTERTSSMPAASRLARFQVESLLSVGYAVGREPAARLPCGVELGLIAAVPLLGAGSIQTNPRPVASTLEAPARRIAGGALLDWRFHERFSLEAGFLTRKFGHRETVQGFSYTESISGYSWEAPLMVKWRAARIGQATLVVGGGPALRRASHVDWRLGVYRLDSSAISRSAAGLALAGGFEIPAGHVRLRPELRYHWFERPLYDTFVVRTRQHSLYLILGISVHPTSSFARRSSARM